MQAESCATYLQKGRGVAIDGRLEWREWEAQDGSGKRQATSIVAERVQFLGSRKPAEGDGRTPPESDVPADASDFEHVRRAASPTTTTCRSDRLRYPGPGAPSGRWRAARQGAGRRPS